MLPALFALHAVQAAIALPVVRWLGPRGFALLAVAPLAGVGLLLAATPGILGGESVTAELAWVEALGVTIDLRADALALLMALLITGIGALVFFYSASYFPPRAGLGRLAATLALFAGSMLGVVVTDNLLVLYVFWELTSLTSFFLIGWEYEDAGSRAAANQAMIVTVAGGLTMLAGFVLLGQEAGTFLVSEMVAAPPTSTTAGVGLALVLVGAVTKSAQVPFHYWLPAAMAAPTPISAYLHSATMVKAGVYLVARLAPVGTEMSFWVPVVVTFGLATMLVGGYRALRQHDLKLLLAYGTVSQLGFMLLLVGGGFGEAAFAGAALILAHGLFKATLFLVTGIVDHEAHTRDIRELPRLAGAMPGLFLVAVVAAASMAGIPGLLGFAAKEAAIDAWLHAPDGTGAVVVLGGVVAGSALTFAYSARFIWGGFLSAPADAVDTPHHRPATAFVAAPALLAVGTVVYGLWPAGVEHLLAVAGEAIEPELHDPHLLAWPGLTLGLAMSAVAVGGGAALFAARQPVERAQARLAVVPTGTAVHDGTVAVVNRGAARLTGVVQSGSLPMYLAVILTTSVVVPAVALVGTPLPEEVTATYSWVQTLAGALVVVAVVAAARARHRFAAALLLGTTGYGVAALFVIQGAPDLGLTQVLVETVAVVMFVLVLRHLPPRFTPRRWLPGQAGRLVLAAAVGLFVATFAVLAAGARTAPPVSAEYAERSVPEAHAENVVNAILVDFRAFDTLGEITVLTVAALGIVSLVRASRKPSS